ncbi:sensor histidine kinase [Cerasicoccus fimbriatus]|uniref:sensor histidine kinase n=1 Tax=Cerasicoccus fimbriatus TaxID=3014554 RepID=UPI0022B32CBE|nr:HAMP domain-containing sensor histidine kinase [Cerasicoccus sp. TK19100]
MATSPNAHSPAFKLYAIISRLPWPKSFTGKLMVVAFVGVHIPLIATVGFAVISMRDNPFPVMIVITCLLATLVGTGLTLLVQSKMLAPVRRTSEALKDFNSSRKAPHLPVNYEDEVGVLMAETQRCLTAQAELLGLKNRFFRTLSHDLRSPLASINDACMLLKLEGDNMSEEERNGLLSDIDATAREQLELIQGLLRLAIAEGSSEAAAKEPVDVNQLLNRAAHQSAAAAAIREVKLVVQPPKASALQVLGDQRLLSQIINNFVSNSIKHTDANGKVIISAESIEGKVRLKVSDDGIGLDEERVKRIQSGIGLTPSEGLRGETGIGLGLQICHDCARLMGTQIQVESTPGKGSTFFVDLPAA